MVDPSELTTAVTTWVGAAVIITTIVAAGLLKILPVIRELGTQVESLWKAHEANKQDIRDNTAQITYVAAQTPVQSEIK